MNANLGKARDIFIAAVAQVAPDHWGAYLAEACGEDAELRRRVEHLLQLHVEAGSFLESPAPALVATVDEQPVSEGPGTVIGPYKLLEQIGEGGFGVVFMTEQQQPVRRKVALKVLKPGMDTRQVVARFEAERQALALMDHPHIAKVLDAGATESGRPFFVMELVKGIPLIQFCDANRLTLGQRLELFVTICQAVQHAHTKGVIHRDLKPSNVLVTLYDGVPVAKVIDFGIAKAIGQQLTDKTLVTGFAQLIGTPLYMSPEQTELSGLDVDTRSDIYSLGVLLYELLTGMTPFDQERLSQVGFDELRRIIREEEPPKPSTRISRLGQAAATVSANRQSDPKKFRQFLRGELDWVVMKALEKDRSRRYETASAFAADVQRYLRDEPVEACPPSAWYRFRKFARRHRRGLLPAAVAALAGVALVAGALLLQREQARTAEARARAATELAAAEAQARSRLETQLYYQLIALAEREWLANNLGRMRQLLEECPGDLRGWEWHYLNRRRYQNLPPLDHDDVVRGAVFSPDGQRIATASHDGAVTVWDVQTGQKLLHFRAHDKDARVAFSPDGRRLATVGFFDGTLKTWDARTGEPLPLRKPHERRLGSVAFSPDGRYLAGAGQEVWVWDAATGEDILHLSLAGRIAFSPDGRRLAVVGPDSAGSESCVTVWDVPTGQKQLSVGHAPGVGKAAFSADGRLLAATFGDGVKQASVGMKVWDAQTGQELLHLRGHTAAVYGLAFSPDGRRLASGSVDQTVKLWDVQTGQEVLTLRGHTEGVTGVAFSPDGCRLVSASFDRTVRVWDATPAAGEPDPGCLTLAGHGEEVNAVAFHPRDRRLLASAGTDGTVRLWDAGSGEHLRTLHARAGLVQGLAFSPDGRRLAAAGQKSVRVWDTTTWQEETPPSPLATRGDLLAVAFSPDGRRLAAGGWAKHPVTVWDAATGKLLHELPKDWVVRSLAFSPDSGRLAWAGYDGTVRVWDMATGAEVVRPPLRHGGGARGVAFSPDGQRLASASYDWTVRVWDTTTWKPLFVLLDPTGGVQSVAFSPDGQRLAWGSTDASVKVWDEAGGQIHTLRGHTGRVNGVAFSPDGSRIASASTDGTVKIWEAPPVAEPPWRGARDQDP